MTNDRSRVGLAVMRLQCLHFGHLNILNKMIQSCETAILVIGSAEVSRTMYDPWTIEERQEMVKNVYGSRIKIIPINNLGATRKTNEWCDYVLNKIQKVGLDHPTDYYTGSEADSVWYRERFYKENFSPEIEDSYEINYLTPTGTKRELHILDRTSNLCPAATDIRLFLQMNNEGWKKWTPRVNHKLIESTYPKEFIMKSNTAL